MTSCWAGLPSMLCAESLVFILLLFFVSCSICCKCLFVFNFWVTTKSSQNFSGLLGSARDQVLVSFKGVSASGFSCHGISKFMNDHKLRIKVMKEGRHRSSFLCICMTSVVLWLKDSLVSGNSGWGQFSLAFVIFGIDAQHPMDCHHPSLCMQLDASTQRFESFSVTTASVILYHFSVLSHHIKCTIAAPEPVTAYIFLPG